MERGRSGVTLLEIPPATGLSPAEPDDAVATAALPAAEQEFRHLLAAAKDALGAQPATAGRVRQLARLLWRLSRAAFTDPLTGLANRRGFMRDGSRLLTMAARRQRCGVIFFIDVDRLKRVNDVDGHAAGDELLRATARALSATFREGDVIGRVGGDEFAVVTCAARADAAAVILRRFDRVLTRINATRRGWPIEVSVGLAVCTPGRPQRLATLLHRADRNMYDDRRSRAAILAPAEVAPDTADAACRR